MTLYWDIEQGSEEWHGVRADHVGASELASLFGVQPDYMMSPFALYQVKAQRIPTPKVDDGPGSRIWYGKRLEAVIGPMAAEMFEWTINKGPYAADDACQGHGASLDFVISAPGPEEIELGFEGPGVLETKNSDFLYHRDNWRNGEPPDHIVLQLQGQLACSGFKWGAVVCLVGGNQLMIYRYEVRPKIVDRIRSKITAFWSDVETGKEPPVDGTKSTAAAVRTMYPTEKHFGWIDLSANPEADTACVGYLLAEAHLEQSQRDYTEWKTVVEQLLKGGIRAQTEHHRINVSQAGNGRRIRVTEIRTG